MLNLVLSNYTVMKKFGVRLVLLQALFISLLLSNYNASAQKTTIWLVRHAEKADTPATNPPLTRLGQQRAKALLRNLGGNKIAAVYITDFIRTAQTAKPVAEKYKLTPHIYNSNDVKSLAAKILQENKGKTVLIVGHSNTIVPTIVALGCESPFPTLNADDYDILFKVTVKNGSANLEMSYYGSPHHSTIIPQKYDHQLSPVPRPVSNF